jgi:hypothetical protein
LFFVPAFPQPLRQAPLGFDQQPRQMPFSLRSIVSFSSLMAAFHDRNHFDHQSLLRRLPDAWSRWHLRKLIDFDDDTLDKLTRLARDRMATFQELADEAFADLLKKHGIPIDLKDALRKSARLSESATPKKAGSKTRKTTS